MKRGFLRCAAAALALFLFFSFSGCIADSDTPAPLTRVELFNQAAPKTVYIKAAGFVGSGVIIKSEIESVDIITNYHVIKNAYEAREPINVKFYNGDEFVATVVGFIESCDVCVLRVFCTDEIEGFDLNSTEVIGESILAIGYNDGQIGAYDGIISSLGKRIYSNELSKYMFVTQTTAPFAEGCSGGAIIDSSGSLLGLSSYILLTNYEGQSLHTGLSYAIPKAIVLSAYQRIISSSAFPARPLMGFTVNSDYSVTVVFNDYLFDVAEADSCLVVSNSKCGKVLNNDRIAKINGIELNAADKMVTFLSELIRTYNQTWFTLY